MIDTLERQARATIAAGSKSFAVASRVFDPATRRSATLLYLWCRHCDDVIDGQDLGHVTHPVTAGSEHALLALRTSTALAHGDAPVDGLPFAALQEVIRRHDIPFQHTAEHLDGFAMDVAGRRYGTLDDTLSYCYHVAGVVGIMMSHIMGARDPKVLDRACDLGLAFQLTNIARDVVEDAGNGRCYLPEAWLEEVGLCRATVAAPEHRDQLAQLVARMLTLAEAYYASARRGIAALPPRSAWAVATALLVYRGIGRRALALGPRAWDQRVSTSSAEKLQLLAAGARMARTARREPGRAMAPRAEQLWQRPR